MSAPNPLVWSREEERAFENVIAMLHSIDDSKEQCLMVPNKTIEELKQHYQLLVDDVTAIEYGYVPIPNYTIQANSHGYSRVSADNWQSNRNEFTKRNEKGYHGLKKSTETYGKGDWRSISRNSVISRTPSQVASHAQKYFNRLNSNNGSRRRRTSIHDIII